MKKLSFIFCGLMCSVTILFSQTTYLNNYVQPAPNAASLGKFVDYPVGYYTGVPNINIPLLDVKDGGIELPITLSYHASGIRISEIASWVGLGWTLNAGGVLIRTVRGAPDEGTKHTGWPFSDGPLGYYQSNGIKKLSLLPYPNSNGVIVNNSANQQMYMWTIPQMQSGNLDGEPDLFTFNANGISGKFVFDENRNPRLLSDDNTKITVDYSNGSFESWKITSPNGMQYFFGENGMYEVTKPHSTQSDDDLNSTVPSSWYLTKIVNPNTADTAYFYYSTEVYSYRDLGPESSVYPNLTGSGGSQIYTDYNQACDNTNISINLITTKVTGLRLDSIKTKNYTVIFVAKTARQDLLKSTGPYKLDSIKLFNSHSQCLKQFRFTHSYFISPASGTTSAVTTFLTQYNNDSTDAKRLKLVSVTEFSGDGSKNKPAYKFTYEESIKLPRRLSYDQDHWGYCNNNAGTANHFFTPPVSDGICQAGSSGANRNAKWPDMSAFSLTALQSPIGEKTIFQYESNYVANVPPMSTVGGLRIKEIDIKDSVTGNTQVRKFSYSPGILYKMPKYLIRLDNEFYKALELSNYFSYKGYNHTNLIGNLMKQSQSIVPLQDAQGNHIGYPIVTETFGANGEGGYKIYKFQADFQHDGDSRLNMSNYTAQATINDIYGSYSGIFGNGHFNDISPENLVYYNWYDVGDYYPYAPQQIDLRRGRLLGEYTYDSTGDLLQSVENGYHEEYHEEYLIRGIKVNVATTYSIGASQTGYTPRSNYGLAYYKLHTGNSFLDSTVTVVYKDGKAMRTAEHFGYRSDYHNLVTNDTTINSEGESIIATTNYSFDYSNSADAVFAKMKARNMLVPINKAQWKNNKLISGSITQYKDFAGSPSDTFINPLRIYALETSSALTTSAAGMNINTNSLINTLVPNSYFQAKATFTYNGQTGKIAGQKLTNDKNQVIIWDHERNLPVSVIDNADISEVAYSSFEGTNTNTGNWSYNQNSVISDATAPTGVIAYVLSSGNPITKSGLSTSKKYILSYWAKSGASVAITGGTQSNSVTGSTVNGWTYHQTTINSASSISIGGSGRIDEVRFYPSDAQMTTYTYDEGLRLSYQCSVNSTITSYEYDGFDRLIDIKDQYGNILKAFDYNYGVLSR